MQPRETTIREELMKLSFAVLNLQSDVTTLKTEVTDHVKEDLRVSRRVEKMGQMQMVGIAAISGMMIGSKMISPESIEAIKSILGF